MNKTATKNHGIATKTSQILEVAPSSTDGGTKRKTHKTNSMNKRKVAIRKIARTPMRANSRTGGVMKGKRVGKKRCAILRGPDEALS